MIFSPSFRVHLIPMRYFSLSLQTLHPSFSKLFSRGVVSLDPTKNVYRGKILESTHSHNVSALTSFLIRAISSDHLLSPSELHKLVHTTFYRQDFVRAPRLYSLILLVYSTGRMTLPISPLSLPPTVGLLQN